MTKFNAPAQSIKILIIDVGDRKWDASLFSSIGPCEIVRTSDPVEGLAHFVRSSIDVAILCMNDKKQCMDIIRFFKSVSPLIPIIVNADHASKDFIISALRADTWDFFKGPTHQAEIADSVRQALLSKNGGKWSDGGDNPIWKTLRYIDEHFAEHISLSKASDLCEMSVSCFQRRFKREVGLSLNKYVNLLRISKARQLLHDHGKSIRDIAHSCGFTNPYHFSRTFKKLMNTSPQSFRKSHAPKSTLKSRPEERKRQNWSKK